jgi:hypothetical protein
MSDTILCCLFTATGFVSLIFLGIGKYLIDDEIKKRLDIYHETVIKQICHNNDSSISYINNKLREIIARIPSINE